MCGKKQRNKEDLEEEFNTLVMFFLRGRYTNPSKAFKAQDMIEVFLEVIAAEPPFRQIRSCRYKLCCYIYVYIYLGMEGMGGGGGGFDLLF